MRTLFLIDEALSRDKTTIDRLRSRGEGDERVVVPLSTLASLSLQREGVPIVRADEHFPMERWESMDLKAADLCRRWHEVLSAETQLLRFHGVSIGEALELDFYFVFVDAVRSSEIAASLLKDSYDKIFMPPFDVQSIRDTTYTTCFETLPPLVAYMAARKGIPVVTLGRERKNGSKQYGFTVSCALFLKENGRDLVSLVIDPEKPRYAFSFFSQDGIIENLTSSGGKGLSIPPHGNLQTRESRRHVVQLLRYLRSEAAVSKLNEATSYNGVHLWSVLYPLLQPYLSKQIRAVVGLTQWTEFLVKRLRLDCCVSRDDVSPYRNPMCQVLRNNGVPIVIIQDGLRTNDMTGNYVMPKVGNVHATWGEYYKKWHVDRGKSAENQVITGFPRHDRLVRLPPVDREAICRRFGLDPNRKIALVATEWYQAATTRYMSDVEEGYARLVFRALKPHKDLQIVAKLHPYFQERCGRIVSEIAEQEKVDVVIAKDSLWELIQVSSFVVVYLSTVTVEALIIGKPVISVNLVDGRDITGLTQEGLAIGAYDEESFDRAVRKCLSMGESCIAADGERQELLLPFTGPLDGRSSERVAQLIESQVKQR
jgi:hypothetical protein